MRRSSTFSRLSRGHSANCAEVGFSGASPRSASSWRTYLRDVSAPTPNSPAPSAMVRPSESRYSCIPRARNSGGYLLGRDIVDSFPDPVDQDQKPPEKRGNLTGRLHTA